MSESKCGKCNKFGLSVNDDGILILNGEPFYGYGLNIYSAFQGLLYPEGSIPYPAGNIYKEDFAMMKEFGLPLARIPLSCWASQHFKMWMDDPDSYFEKMDKVIAEAEKVELGIVVSLMWRVEAVSENVGEPVKEMGNPNSKIVEVSKKYIGEVVSRYKNSPAIWMWEIGNEFNLPADLDAKYVGGFKNCYTTDDFIAYQSMMAEHIRTIDPFRAMTTGNAMVRATAHHLMQKGYSTEDSTESIWYMPEPTDYDTSLDEYTYMLHRQNPDPINVCSIHMQHWRADGMAVEEMAGKFVPYLEYLTETIKAGAAVRKPIYFGEFGDMMQFHYLGEHYNDNLGLMIKNFYIVTNALVDSGLQIATAWLMGTVPGYMFTTVRENGSSHNLLFQIEEFVRINKMFREQGKQKAADYWKWAKT
jgi:hypothetical protein